jgi:hypothetical protein
MFDAGTRLLVELAEEAARFERFARADARLADLFCLLEDCEARGRPEEAQGASYRTLLAVAESAGLGEDLRGQFYAACERLGLSERHATHMRERLLTAAGAAPPEPRVRPRRPAAPPAAIP